MRTAPDGRGIVSCLELPAVQDRPAALLDRADVARSQSSSRSSPRSATSTSRSSSSSSTRRTCCSTGPPRPSSIDRPDGAPDPLQGRRNLLLHPAAEGRSGRRPRPARQPHPARAARLHPEDAKALKAAVSTYPKSEFYDLEELLPSLGIGEAAVTILSESGVPTPVVQTRMRAPGLAHGPGRRRRRRCPGLEPAGEVRHAGGRESAREKLAARLEREPAKPAQAPKRRSAATKRRPRLRSGAGTR